jgi:apolipoprotein N-acyltransferase
VPVALGFLLSAVLGILSFPPVGGWFLSYIALVPFLASATTATPGRALRWGYLSGLVFFGGIIYWIGLNSGAPAPLAWASVAAMILILATIWAMTAWAVSKVSHRFGLAWAALLFVILYVFLEVFWGSGEMGFPWAILGLTQIGFLPAAQMADIGDVYGLSLWVLAINACIFILWRHPPLARRTRPVLLVLIVVPLAYGIVRLHSMPSSPTVNVAAVQGNTPVGEKWNMSADEILDNYLALTRSLAGTNTALAVWPETATPMAIRFNSSALQKIHALTDSIGVQILTGATDYEQDATKQMLPYNASFLFRPHEVTPWRSAKVRLVPFGERIPGQKLFPFLGKIRLGQAEFMPGSHPVVFPASRSVPPFGCLICFEVVFPDIAADQVLNGALMLAAITEDGWYGNSSGPYQHLALARLRAIAERRSMVRSANTGISALILPTGQLITTLAYNRQGVIRGSLPICTDVTVAARLARVWPYFYSILLLLILGRLFMISRREKRDSLKAV